jgi:acyl-coenzyme A thioesterase PaaI-like protein
MQSRCATLLGKHILNEQDPIQYGYTMREGFTHSGHPAKMETTAIVQGGFLAASLVDAATSAARLVGGPSLQNLSVLESKLTYLLPARIGRLVCKVKIQRLGGRVGSVEVMAYQHEKLLATASLTLILSRGGREPVSPQYGLASVSPVPWPRAMPDNATNLISDKGAPLPLISWQAI